MASYLLDLSNAPGQRNDLTDIDVPADARPDSVRVLNVARSSLVSLEVSLETRLHDIVRHVTTLQVPFNQLTSFAGIDAFVSLEVLNVSHNNLTVVDANGAALLHRLQRLQVVDLSHNKMRLIDLGALAAKSMALGSASSMNRPVPIVDEGHLMAVTSLNLSHNALIDLPDLRMLPSLQVLNLDCNKIEDITDADGKLPMLSLHTLQMRENQLLFATSVVPLTVLANTLRHLQLYGNPFTMPLDEEEVIMSAQASRVNSNRRASILPSGRLGSGMGNPWWWRPFVLWLVPLAQTLDTTEFTVSECTVAAALFRERGALSKSLIELLNANRRDELETYLRVQAERATPPANALDAVLGLQEEDRDDASARVTPVLKPRAAPMSHNSQQRSSMAEPFEPLHNNEWLPTSVRSGRAQQPGGYGSVSSHTNSPSAQARLPSVRSTGAGVGGGSGGSSSVPVVLAAMQQKLRTLSGVVETLWQYDMSRRTFAAIVIQKYYRSYAARRDLPEDVQESVQFIRQQLAMQPAAGSGAAMAAASRSTGHRGSLSTARQSGEMAKATAPVVPTGNQAADIQEVLSSMKGLQSVMTTMWEDLDEYRAMAEREQRRAAITIQRHYRGYRGRQQWREFKTGYDDFVNSLGPYVLIIQRVGRGYLAREKIHTDADGKYEVHRLRGEVDDLRAELRELRAALGLPTHKNNSTSSNGTRHNNSRSRGIDGGKPMALTSYATERNAAVDDDAAAANSTTVSILNNEGDDGFDSDPKEFPLATRGASAPATTSGERRAPVRIQRRLQKGSGPMRLSEGGRGTARSDADSSTELGSDSEARLSKPEKRILKRRPSVGASGNANANTNGCTIHRSANEHSNYSSESSAGASPKPDASRPSADSAAAGEIVDLDEDEL